MECNARGSTEQEIQEQKEKNEKKREEKGKENWSRWTTFCDVYVIMAVAVSDLHLSIFTLGIMNFFCGQVAVSKKFKTNKTMDVCQIALLYIVWCVIVATCVLSALVQIYFGDNKII